MNRMKEKRGSSLLEVIVAVALLAIVVVTVVGGIGMARQSVLNNNVQDDYTAKAQDIADTLITYLSSDTTQGKPKQTAMQSITDNALCVTNADTYVASWIPNDSNNKQFTYKWVGVDPNNPISGYKIEVRVYYNSGKEKKYSTFTAFAACTGGEFQ